MDEKDKLQVLKDILFTDDREYAEKISKRIDILEQTINERKKLSTKVDPIVEQQLKEFTRNIPSTLGPSITAALKEEIRNHKDEVVDILFPILGKMIKKYISQEIRILSEKVNSKLGFKGFKRKVRSWFGGVKEEELILSELSSARIEQVLLIEKESGILAASYSITKTIDEEMISGMLTAIKTFAEDAFGQKNQRLELIEYELYNIHLQSFIAYYVAVVISGDYSIKSKDKVQDMIFNFYENFTKIKKSKKFDADMVHKELITSFGDASI
ncbi:MAG: cell envelope biogenesis protein OmpA [Bacteroidota bacterium]